MAIDHDWFECQCGQAHKTNKYSFGIDCYCGRYYVREEWEDFNEKGDMVRKWSYRQSNIIKPN